MDDVIPTALTGFLPDGKETSQLSLRFNPAHKWFYYPNMTVDEVLVFKQFECIKGIDDLEDATFKTNFHTAVDDPNTPQNCEKRTSCEFRMQIWWDY